MTRAGLRATMLVPLLTALTVGSLALGLFVYRAVEADQMATVDGEVARALAAAVRGLGDPDRPARTGSSDIGELEVPLQFTVAADGRVIDGPDDRQIVSDARLTDLAATGGIVTFDGEPRYRAGARTTPAGPTVVIALSLRSVDSSLASLRRNLLLGGVVLVAVQALVVALVARRVTGPVVRLSTVAHRIASGDFAAAIGPPSGPRETAALTTDLTAMLARLRDAIDDRERAAADAERARADMERFMADASHELRTPLTALRGYSDLHLAGMLDADGLDRAMTRIGDESVRLSSLVRDLLQLVQPADPLLTAPVDLGAIASAVVHDLRAAHPAHAITHDLGASDGYAIRGDAARLHQAILNLAGNACQHTPGGTSVVVTVARHDDVAVVAVEDHGPGIDPELTEAIFQPFTRGEVSRSRSRHDGTGLGLAIAQRIVHQHGGTIAVGPTAGGGATFTVCLPIDPTGPTSEPHSSDL